MLQAAHDQQIIHRDLKPGNLMVVDAESPREKIKVMDFGLAKMIDPATLKKITDTNVDFAVGTPGYICPEQVRGEDVDHRGDIYSVGVLIYELLTGRLPFECPNSMDMLLAHATELPPTFARAGFEHRDSARGRGRGAAVPGKRPVEAAANRRELAAAYEEALAELASPHAEVPPPPHTPLPNHVPEKPFQAHFVTASRTIRMRSVDLQGVDARKKWR